MPVKKQLQESFDQNVILDAELLDLLEKREAKQEAKTEFARLSNEARERINEKGYGNDGDVRVGPYIIGKRPVAARSVKFKTTASTRIVIKRAEEAEEGEE